MIRKRGGGNLPKTKNPARSRLDCERGVPRQKSELRFQSELEHSRVERGGDLSEIAVVHGSADVLKLRVVEDVEALCPELDLAASFLAEDEALEQGQVPVVAAGSLQRVQAQVAPLPDGWGAERTFRPGPIRAGDLWRGVEPVVHRARIVERANHIGPVSSGPLVVVCPIRQAIVGRRSAQIDLQRQTSLGGNEARDLPAAESGPQRPARGVPEGRNVIEEVGVEDVVAIEPRRSYPV